MAHISLSVDDIFTDPAAYGLADLLERVQLQEGDVLFREGDTADSLYFVKKGLIRIELERDEIDSDAVLAQIPAGGIVGELGLLDQSTRSATAIADGPVELWRLSAESLSQLERSQPDKATLIYKTLGAAATGKLRRSNARLATAIFETRDPEVERQVTLARAALPFIAAATEEEVENLLESLTTAFEREAESLAQKTVEETGMGNVADKVTKNHYASRAVRETLRGKPGSGVLPSSTGNIVELAAAAGIVFGLIPVTNPVATAIFKCLICLKSRNALILSFPRRAAKIGNAVSELIAAVLNENGWPDGLVQTAIKQNSRKRTEAFFHHPGIALILATGGPSMVEAAYRSGRPAIGVGPGNAPVLVCSDANIAVAAGMIVESKAFDNGLICGSEHNLVVLESVAEEFRQALQAAGAAVLDPSESQRFRAKIFNETQSGLGRRWFGVDAAAMAYAADIQRDYTPRVIVIPASAEECRHDHILAGEKMAPVLSLFSVADETQGINLCQKLLCYAGRGHTAVIHSSDRHKAEVFALAMPASRILVNTPATHGVIGLTSELLPSLTLGCGLFGGNSTNDNVTFTHVRNIKRMAFHRQPPESI